MIVNKKSPADRISSTPANITPHLSANPMSEVAAQVLKDIVARNNDAPDANETGIKQASSSMAGKPNATPAGQLQQGEDILSKPRPFKGLRNV
ncbi:MAG: hypothetical protein JWQ23_2625 [Herminiimonas sp.]|nr:hypothetical protein [Herminiimonas sp.]